MNTTEIEQRMQNVRTLLQQIYSDISRQHNSLLPTPDASVKAAGNLINQEQYDVVVCGEVKKGKSSFINALMGEQILPTNTQVATSQVCRIINSDREEYNLVFTDGTRQRITKQELSKYGSQIDADLYGEPIFRNHQLDYIEVKHPIPALPESIALVDTPGIGAVYAAHEQITRNYLKKAAAVIFIIDPKNPIVKQEQEFIESALKVTRQIMFVMTKMDNYDEGVIATMISRDENILAPLASKTADGKITILPISSTILFDATKEKDELLLEMSCFSEVKEALMKMIYNTIGFEINAGVYNALNGYNTRVMQTLNELHASATSQPDKAIVIAEQKRQKQKEFAAQWGANGPKIQEIKESVNKHIRTLENEVRDLFSQNHYIYKNMSEEIDALHSVDEAKRLSRSMGGRLSYSYGKAWKDMMEHCEDSIDEVLAEYNAHLNEVSVDGYTRVNSFQQKTRSFAERLSSGRNSYFTGMFVTSLFAIPMAIVAAPLTAAIAVFGALFGIGAGVATHKDTELKQWKQQLRDYLNKCYSQIHDEFLVKPVENGLTRLQAAEDDIQKNTAQAIQQIYNQHKANTDRQLQLLEEQAQADASARQQRLNDIQQLQQQWKPIYDKLCQAKQQLTLMEKTN